MVAKPFLSTNLLDCCKRYTIRSLDLIKDDKTFRAGTETTVSAHSLNNNQFLATVYFVVLMSSAYGCIRCFKQQNKAQSEPESEKKNMFETKLPKGGLS